MEPQIEGAKVPEWPPEVAACQPWTSGTSELQYILETHYLFCRSAHSFSVLFCVCAQLCPTFCSPPGSSVMGFPRQENWSGLPFPSSGGLPDTGMEPASFASPVLAGGFFITAPPAVQVCCPFSS